MGERRARSEQAAGVTQLGYLGLSVSDPAAWQALLGPVLGLQVRTAEQEGLSYFRMDDYHHRLCLQSGAEDRLRYIGWQVADASAMEAIANGLVQAGIAVEEGTPEELGVRKVAGMVRLKDPNDYPLELFYGPKIPAEDPFQPARPISGFRTGQLGLGHFLGTAWDVKETEAFYTRYLGFRVTDYSVNGGVFLRCNQRHHSVGFHPVGSFGPQSDTPVIRHVLFEVTALDDLGLVADACDANDVPVAITIGRHSNDRMVSMYVSAPSLFQIEYGWDGLLVDEERWVVRTYSKGDLWGHKRLNPAEQQAHRGRLNARGGRFPWLT